MRSAFACKGFLRFVFSYRARTKRKFYKLGWQRSYSFQLIAIFWLLTENRYQLFASFVIGYRRISLPLANTMPFTIDCDYNILNNINL